MFVDSFFFYVKHVRETLLYTFLSDINKRITYAWTYFLNQNCHLNSFKRNQTFQNRFCKLLNIYNLFLTKKINAVISLRHLF